MILLALSLFFLPRSFRRVLEVFAVSEAPGRVLGTTVTVRLVAAATALAALVRFFIAPHWIVTMYIGYLLTEQSIELSTASHYGVGSQVLYHALFSILPRDHASLLWTNSVVGVLLIPIWAALGARLLGSRTTGAVFALLLALVPLFIKNDNSDANHVPCLLWLGAGLLLFDEFLDGGHRTPLLASLALLALAAISRPEMPLLVPLYVMTLVIAMPPPRARLRQPVFLAFVLVAALFVLPHVLHVAHATDVLAGRDSLPGWSTSRLRGLSRLLMTRNTVLTPTLYPAGLLPFALYALIERDRNKRRTVLVLLALATLVLAVYGLDLCRANMARVHVPGAMLVTLLAAAGIRRVFEQVPSQMIRAAIVAAIAATAIPTIVRLWAPTNEQAEERFIRESIARLPASAPYTLVRSAREDRNRSSQQVQPQPGSGSDFTHYHFPDYLIREPAGSGRVSSIVDWLDAPDFTEPAYFYLGMRCYAEFREEGVPPPHGNNLQASCARMQERFVLEPVVEREVQNRGDVWMEYYGSAPSLRLGLYRMTGVKSAPAFGNAREPR